MFINKIGQNHLDYGINNQDYGFEMQNQKMVCDGCSEGKHSEVGVKLFCHVMKQTMHEKDLDRSLLNEAGLQLSMMKESFEKASCYMQTDEDKKNYLSFTILNVYSGEKDFIVSYCGDGYIITQDYNDDISFIKIDNGDYPKYLVYNYIEQDMKLYNDGVKFEQDLFSKEKYKNVGVASDGIRFILDNLALKDEFVELLMEYKEFKIKRFINKNQKMCKDDITIVF